VVSWSVRYGATSRVREGSSALSKLVAMARIENFVSRADFENRNLLILRAAPVRSTGFSKLLVFEKERRSHIRLTAIDDMTNDDVNSPNSAITEGLAYDFVRFLKRHQDDLSDSFPRETVKFKRGQNRYPFAQWPKEIYELLRIAH
jgi:hypothetical protein